MNKLKLIITFIFIFCISDKISATNIIYAFRHDISTNDIIHPNMLTMIDIDKKEYEKINQNANYIRSFDDLIGKTVKKNIKAGVPLEKNMVKDLILIKKSNIINVIYNKESIKIKTKGKALENGYYQDYIKIKMQDTGNIIKGKVMIDGTASIE